MSISPIHFNKFLELVANEDSQFEVGYKPSSFVRSILSRMKVSSATDLISLKDKVPTSMLSREKVFEICRKEDVNLLYKVICIFSWGNMLLSTSNPVLFFGNWSKHENDIDKILKSFSSGEIDRVSAYNKLNELQLHGCGPAFFTKLLYFFGSGYILDQWTGKSIELLFDREDQIGIIFSNGAISRKNTGEIYEKFCNRIEALTAHLNQNYGFNLTPGKTEELIFSSGGKKPGLWRSYVKSQFLK